MVLVLRFIECVLCLALLMLNFMLVHNVQIKFGFAHILATEHATNQKVNRFMTVDASY